MNIEHISVSRKKCYDTCELEYKYRYHLKIKVDKPEPEHFLYGTFIHRVAEEYTKCRGKTSIQEIAKQILTGKILLEQEGDHERLQKLSTSYKQKMGLHLKRLAKIISVLGYDGYVEYRFQYDLEPPNKKLVLGFIDRLIIKDNKALIVDYKTTKPGKWMLNKQNIGSDLQLSIYCGVVHREFGIPYQNIHAGLYYLETGKLVGCNFSEKNIKEAEKSLLETYDKIAKQDPDTAKGRYGFHCKYCDYNHICPVYRHYQQRNSLSKGFVKEW